jgi:squalene-associated FAD-dependent desaturase
MMAGRTHIIGGGLAGLSTAVNLIRVGREVSLYEGAGHCGGRCRSYFEPALDRRIDNGNHLVLSGNRAALDYLDHIGAPEGLRGPEHTAYSFLDLDTAERWTVTLDAGFLPRAMLSKGGRVPGSSRGDYLKAFRLVWAGEETTVAQCLGPENVLFRRFWEPLAVAILNTDAHEAAASLLKPVIRETFGRGAVACRPLIAREGLSETFIDPAVVFLAANGAAISLNTRLHALTMETGRVTELEFNSGTITLSEDDSVVLAVPPLTTAALLPGLEVPSESRAIVNGHFKLEREADDLSFLGLIGGTAQWLFVRGDIVSVTVSAADTLAEQPAEDIARTLWSEVARALDLADAPLPAHRIVKEKRATFAQTPEQIRRRAAVRTEWANLFLAGDWTDTGLPATIEGTIRSGRMASETVLISSR